MGLFHLCTPPPCLCSSPRVPGQPRRLACVPSSLFPHWPLSPSLHLPHLLTAPQQQQWQPWPPSSLLCAPELSGHLTDQPTVLHVVDISLLDIIWRLIWNVAPKMLIDLLWLPQSLRSSQPLPLQLPSNQNWTPTIPLRPFHPPSWRRSLLLIVEKVLRQPQINSKDFYSLSREIVFTKLLADLQIKEICLWMKTSRFVI